MRLVSLELSGFRGFAQRQTFDFSANAIIIVGPNGHGKTSLLEGILWALTGAVPRLQGGDVKLICLFSDSGEARASLTLNNVKDGATLTITRSSDRKDQRVSVKRNGETQTGAAANAELIKLFWPDAAAASNPNEALASIIARCTYLQQDSIRSFIEADTSEARFDAVSELVGTGRVTELQVALEKSKRAWTTISNQRAETLRELKAQASALRNQVDDQKRRSAEATQPSIDEDAWREWHASLSAAGVSIGFVQPGAREASSIVDAALKDLDNLIRSARRRKDNLDFLAGDMQRKSGVAPEMVSKLQEQVALEERAVGSLRRELSTARHSLEETTRLELEVRLKGEHLRALASLALEQLGELCPVCEQTYDRPATEARLRAIMVDELNPAHESASQRLLRQIGQLSVDSDAAAERLATAERSLRNAGNLVREWETHLANINSRFVELQVEEPSDGNRLAAIKLAQASNEEYLKLAASFRETGERFALSLASAAAENSLKEAVLALTELEAEARKVENDVNARNFTGELGQTAIESLRQAASAVVSQRLTQLGPLLQSIWARIDPHPAFRIVEYFAEMVRGRGQLSTVIKDPDSAKTCGQPSLVLSSSQMNALAIAVFLSLNLGFPSFPLSVAILDDPLQSLDDVNLLGLVDLFRRAKGERQIIVSTHDSRFAQLLAKKLRPKSTRDRTLIIEIEAWNREGPSVQIIDVQGDPVPMRLVS